MRTVALSHLEFRILWESYDGKSSLMLVRIQQRIELVKKDVFYRYQFGTKERK